MLPVRKGTTKRCCYGVCNSDTRYKSFLTNTYYFINFPKPCLEYRKKKIKTSDQIHIKTCPKCRKCELWVKKCDRSDKGFQSIDNVTKDTYICSLHFYGESGPTEKYPDPLSPQEFQEIYNPNNKVQMRTTLFEFVDIKEENIETAELTTIANEEIHDINGNNYRFNSQIPCEFFIFRDEYF